MANSVEIANLQIKIADNAKTASKNVSELASSLQTLKSASTGSGLKAAASSIERVSKSVQAFQTTVKKSTTTGFGGEMQKAAETAKSLGDRLGSVSAQARSFASSVKTAFGNIVPSALKRTINQFYRLAKMRIMRTIIKNLMSGMTEGLKNVYGWAKLTGDSFASSMDTISTATNYAKNSVGAAFSTLLTALAPIIDRIVDIVVDAINYINMFIAVLNGEGTYIRAKKTVKSWADTTSSSLGSVAGSIHEVEEALSVLDFDELNQLQAPDVSTSSGGGGGGGGGVSTSPTATDFERVKVESNWLTQTAEWLKENFETISGIVAAIGSAILGWKVSEAFSNVVSQLGVLGTAGSIALSLAGFTLEAKGAEDIGENGPNVKNLIETFFGASTGIASAFFRWGAESLLITVPLAITVGIVSMILGVSKKAREFDKTWQNSDEYKELKTQIDNAIENLNQTKTIRVTVDKIMFEYNKNMSKIEYAQSLVDELSGYDGILNPTQTQLGKIEELVGKINALKLDGVTAEFEVLNGKVKTNVDQLNDALQNLRDIATQAALTELYTEQTTAVVNLVQANQEFKTSWADYDSAYKQYQEQYNADHSNGKYVTVGWEPGDPVGDIVKAWNPELAKLMETVNMRKEAFDISAENAHAAVTEYDRIKGLIETLEDILKNDLIPAINANTDAYLRQASAFTNPYTTSNMEDITGVSQNPHINGGNDVLQEQFEQITGGTGLNIYADPTLNANFTGFAETIGKAATHANELNQGMTNLKTTVPDSGVELQVVSSVIDQFGEFTEVAADSTDELQTAIKDAGTEAKKSEGGFKLAETSVENLEKEASTAKEAVKGMASQVNGAKDATKNLSGVQDTLVTSVGKAVTKTKALKSSLEGAEGQTSILKKTTTGLVSTQDKQAAYQWAMTHGYKELAQGMKMGGEQARNAYNKITELNPALKTNSEKANTAATKETKYAQELKSVAAQAKTAGGNVKSVNTSLSNVGKDVSISKITSTLKNTFSKGSFGSIGSSIKGKIESPIKNTGAGIKNGEGLSKNLKTIFYNTQQSNLSGIGSSIKGKVESTAKNIGSGITDGTNLVKKLKTAFYNTQHTNLTAIGTSVKGKVEQGVNTLGDGVKASKNYTKSLKQTFYSDNIVGLLGIGTNIKDKIEQNVNTTGSTVSGSGIAEKAKKSIYSDNVATYTTIGSSIKGKIETGIDATGNGISYSTIMTGIKTGLQTAENNTSFSSVGKSIGSDMESGIKSGLSSIYANITSTINGAQQNAIKFAASFNWFANGGYPTPGELFVAGENPGNVETIGTLGGRTAVVNRDQIASALAQALTPMLSNANGKSGQTNLNLYLDSQVVAKASAKGQAAMNKQFNLTAKA